ncbi:hypothetical protein Agub_g4525 [Astrephomene gubernaculifera]|uniref:Uncharacterized protein n=1 Tax=Astrephomene gubernaculifera TaxID=47775 RepID=A0AAD3HJY3_9CHLO|nr:hypothetical protein Agub_g4525 [Astrephomene gubernaculifera]
MMVCLCITVFAASRYARSSAEGTLWRALLGHWQRSRGGVPKGETISSHPRVHITLRRALQSRAPSRPEDHGAKAPLTLGILRLLVGWLAARAVARPEVAARSAADVCWLVVGFFGLLRCSELFALTPADIKELPGGGGCWCGSLAAKARPAGAGRVCVLG